MCEECVKSVFILLELGWIFVFTPASFGEQTFFKKIAVLDFSHSESHCFM